jgi:hypothetical protein
LPFARLAENRSMSEDQEREHDESTVGDEDASEIDESGENLTQQRLDEETGTSAPVDLPWEDEEPPAGEGDEPEERGAW